MNGVGTVTIYRMTLYRNIFLYNRLSKINHNIAYLACRCNKYRSNVTVPPPFYFKQHTKTSLTINKKISNTTQTLPIKKSTIHPNQDKPRSIIHTTDT